MNILKDLPIDVVKIDQEFLEQMTIHILAVILLKR
ncbi:MAG: hypothetical protein ACLTC1_05860 [Turicibacter sp.]